MKQKGTLFYWAIVILPILNYLVFFIGVNFNSIVLAFKDVYILKGEKHIDWVKFDNFKTILRDSQVLEYLVKNSMMYFAVTVCVIIPLTLLFSYYIFKKYFASGFFKVMIFMPSVICSMVLAIFYLNFTNEILDKIIFKPRIALMKKDEYATAVMIALFIIGGFRRTFSCS